MSLVSSWRRIIQSVHVDILDKLQREIVLFRIFVCDHAVLFAVAFHFEANDIS